MIACWQVLIKCNCIINDEPFDKHMLTYKQNHNKINKMHNWEYMSRKFVCTISRDKFYWQIIYKLNNTYDRPAETVAWPLRVGIKNTLLCLSAVLFSVKESEKISSH